VVNHIAGIRCLLRMMILHNERFSVTRPGNGAKNGLDRMRRSARTYAGSIASTLRTDVWVRAICITKRRCPLDEPTAAASGGVVELRDTGSARSPSARIDSNGRLGPPPVTAAGERLLKRQRTRHAESE